jgi:hypothetical protein
MIYFGEAVRKLYPQVVYTVGEEAFDAQNNSVSYDKALVQAKLAEMQSAETAAQEAAAAHKESAIAKLAAIGLSADEIKALIG